MKHTPFTLLALLVACDPKPSGAPSITDFPIPPSMETPAMTTGDAPFESSTSGETPTPENPDPTEGNYKSLSAYDGDGNRIGYVTEVMDFSISVYDEERDLVFQVNDLTGNTFGVTTQYFESDGCAGQPNAAVARQFCDYDLSAGRQVYYRPNSDAPLESKGFKKSLELYTASGTAQFKTMASRWSGNHCAPVLDSMDYCAFELSPLNDLPKGFSLPITIE